MELQIHVQRACNLLGADTTGFSDPYLKLRVCTPKKDATRATLLSLLAENAGGEGADQPGALKLLAKKKLWKQKQAGKTQYKNKTCNPEWDVDIMISLELRDVRAPSTITAPYQLPSLPCTRTRLSDHGLKRNPFH